MPNPNRLNLSPEHDEMNSLLGRTARNIRSAGGTRRTVLSTVDASGIQTGFRNRRMANGRNVACARASALGQSENDTKGKSTP